MKRTTDTQIEPNSGIKELRAVREDQTWRPPNHIWMSCQIFTVMSSKTG